MSPESPLAMTPSPPKERSAAAAALLGAAPVLGWLAHDAAVFVTHGWPADALGLVPRSLVALVAGALLGLLVHRSGRVLPALGIGLAAFWLAARFGALDLVGASRPLPGALLLLLAAYVLARSTARGLRLGEARVAVVLGAGGAALVTSRVQALETVTWVVLGSLLVWCVLTSLAGRRAVLAQAILVLPLLWVGKRAESFLALPRADLPASERGALDAATHRPNVLLVILDTLRADHMSCYGYGRATTPELDAFARDRATRYVEARSASSWTLPSHATLYTGLSPAEHGATHPRTPEHVQALLSRGFTAHPLRADVTTIAEELRAAGYQTAAVISNASTLRVEYGMDRGFEHYDARRANFVRGAVALAQMIGAPAEIGHRPYRDGATITDLALGWLDERGDDAPFFLTLNYMDAHLPYMPPASVQDLFDDAQPADPVHPPRELLELLYDRETRYLDAEVGRLLRELDARGLGDDTAIVITSDHGEGFGEHGLWNHDWTLYEELIRVPLLVSAPGQRSGAVEERPITAVEVHGMLRELAGLPVAEQPDGEPPERPVAEWFPLKTIPLHADGRWTKEELERDLHAWLEGDRKWLVGSKGRVEAYDLASDPGEERPLALDPAEEEAARARAAAWWAAHPAPTEALGASMRDAETSDDVLERLRGLGYVGDK